MEIRGSVFIVTGASSGIGAATARLAHSRGAKVVLAARRVDRLEALTTELLGALAIPTDVTVPSQLQRLMEQTVALTGRIDVLVNNAGRGLHVPLEDVDIEGFRDILDLNVVAPLTAMQAVIPVMRAQGAGVIINVSSGTARVAIPGIGAYSASKAALSMLSNVARAELAEAGIVVSTLYPSITATEFHDSLRQGELRTSGIQITPHTPEYVAEALLHLVETGEPEAVLQHDWSAARN